MKTDLKNVLYFCVAIVSNIHRSLFDPLALLEVR